MLEIKHAKEIRINFFNKIVFGKFILKLLRLEERMIHTIMFTITEDRIIPVTPKLYGDKFPKLLIGAPTKNQSKKTLRIIPAKDDLKGNLGFSIV